MTRIAEIAAIPTIVHTEVLSANRTEVLSASIVVAMSAMNVPGMSTTIGCIEVWASEVEVIAMRIAAIDTEVPVTSLPIEWTVEVAGSYVCIPLPIIQNLA